MPFNHRIPKTKSFTFHSAMRTTNIIGQCFGLNPVLGICEKDANKLRFKLMSWRCIYTLMSILGQLWIVCMLIASLIKKSIIAPVDAALEHLFSDLNYLSIALECKPEGPTYETFIRHCFPWLFTVVPYSTVVAILSHILNLQCTFNWNFTDLFVICMSIYLTSRLEQVNRRVVAAKDKNAPVSIWRTMREDYSKATSLVRQVNNVIGLLILVSYASYLFFVCTQLMHTIADGIHKSRRCMNEDLPDNRDTTCNRKVWSNLRVLIPRILSAHTYFFLSKWEYHIMPFNHRIPKTKSFTFHSAMRTTNIIGQCFGLNPVLGICEKDANKLRFKLMSWRCIYTLMSILGQLWIVCMLIASLIKKSIIAPVDAASALLFYSLGLIITVQFLRIAVVWPELCQQISRLEADDPTTDSKLKIKINVICFGILGLAFLEHLFSDLNYLSIALECKPEGPTYETFIRHCFPWLFTVVPYSTVVGILSHILNLQCTFNWNFTDLFVICMSIYLTSRLEQVNRRVVAAKDKNAPVSIWRTMREDYSKATSLVRQVNNVIGLLILVSYASYLFFVCTQLMHTIADGIHKSRRCMNEDLPNNRYMYGYVHTVYFVSSFLFLVAKSLAVSMTASRVYTASLEPAHALYDVSSATYCIEIERFLHQIHSNTVALSGLQFFNVKRGLILSIAGTIVTYELVLMQFTGITPTSSPLNEVRQ